jgi:cytosine/adenosine deaminase-related metal-dependent hydrolase
MAYPDWGVGPVTQGTRQPMRRYGTCIVARFATLCSSRSWKGSEKMPQKRNPASECIIEAGLILAGTAADGTMLEHRDAGIRVKDGQIAEIAPIADLAARHAALPRFGSSRHVAHAGLVNGHHHFGVTPLMQGVPFAPLELWLPQFRAMRRIPPRLDTLYAAIEMLESGTTSVHHIHSGLAGTPEQWMTASDAILGAYGEIGMRAGFSFMVRDRNILGYDDDAALLAMLPAKARDWLAPQLTAAAIPLSDLMAFHRTLIDRWHAAHRFIRPNLAPANLHWCSDGCLQQIFDTARATGATIHMHLVETERQAAFAEKRLGRSAVAHLKALECLGPNLTLGHGNWVSREDLDLLADCGCSICHNASSGLRLGSGIAPVNEMRRRGIPVALGIDQSNIADDRDMTLEMKLVWALHRETGLWNDRLDAAAVLKMTTEHGAATIGFQGEVGRLEVGYEADIVLLDRKALERPFVNPRTPMTETVLHRGGRQAIDKVFVGGRLVVDGGRVVTIDRDAVLAELGEIMARPESAEETAAWEALGALMPALASHHRAHDLGEAYRPYRFNRMAD